MNKDIKEFIKYLRRRGWRVEQGRKHYKARHPRTNKLITFSGTPSCPHAVENIKRDIRRAEEGVYK